MSASDTREGVVRIVTESVTVEGHAVTMLLSVLAPAERARVKSSIVSASLAALDPRLNAYPNQAWLDKVLSTYVTFTTDGDLSSDRLPAWWTLVIRHALAAFIRVSGLSESVRRDVKAFVETGVPHLSPRLH